MRRPLFLSLRYCVFACIRSMESFHNERRKNRITGRKGAGASLLSFSLRVNQRRTARKRLYPAGGNSPIHKKNSL